MKDIKLQKVKKKRLSIPEKTWINIWTDDNRKKFKWTLILRQLTQDERPFHATKIGWGCEVTLLVVVENRKSLYREIWHYPTKLHTHLPYNPAISLPKYIRFKDTLPKMQKDICKRIFMETLFIMIEQEMVPNVYQ